MNATAIKKFFNSQAERWDSISASDSKKLKRITDICDIGPGDRVLDIACGTGVLFEFLFNRQPGFVLGVDICERMAAAARRKHADKRLAVATKDFLRLEVKGFDCAVCYNAYPHFFDKEGFAEKTSEVLRRGARFVLAHGAGKEHINNFHEENAAAEISTKLKSADKEKKWFEPFFDIDTVIDCNDIYVISGKKK